MEISLFQEQRFLRGGSKCSTILILFILFTVYLLLLFGLQMPYQFLIDNYFEYHAQDAV